MKKFFLFVSILFLVGCSTAKLNRLKNCEFSFKGISDVIISGKKIEDLKQDKKAGFMGTSLLGKILFEKEAPMSFNVNVSVKNPNKKNAALDKMEWTAIVDEKELLSGIYNQHFEVKPGETAILTIPVQFDLKEKIMGENGAAIKTFGLAYLFNGNPKGLKIKVRPYIGSVKFPEAFEIKPFQK